LIEEQVLQFLNEVHIPQVLQKELAQKKQLLEERRREFHNAFVLFLYQLVTSTNVYAQGKPQSKRFAQNFPWTKRRSPYDVHEGRQDQPALSEDIEGVVRIGWFVLCPVHPSAGTS
jgi:hypothetical protein